MRPNVLTKAEAKELGVALSFEVSVSKEQIEKSRQANSSHCMIAESIKSGFLEQHGFKPFGVSVDVQTIRFTDRKKGVRYVCLTPGQAQIAIAKFDQGLHVEPFRFRATAAQIIRSARENRRLSPAKKAALAAARKASVAKAKKQRRARVHLRPSNGKGGATATKIGGKAPPRASVTGSVRQFGIRALGNLSTAT